MDITTKGCKRLLKKTLVAPSEIGPAAFCKAMRNAELANVRLEERMIESEQCSHEYLRKHVLLNVESTL